MGLIEPLEYGENFHELYTNASENRKFLLDKKSRQKKKRSDRRLETAQSDQFYPAYALANIELEPNASKFAVFAAVRSAILEADTKYAVFQEKVTIKSPPLSCCYVCGATCQTNNLVECACHTNSKKSQEDAPSEEESEIEEITEKESFAKVPQIVGAGLKSLFELISDARNLQPNLCTKALKALFDVIQGQHPESFKYEPETLINPLYDLLLDLATLHGAAVYDKTTPSGNWSSISCSALLGLCVARGDTGKILKAIAAILMSPKLLSTQIIQLPLVLSYLQKTVISAALNRPSKPDFFSHGIPKNSVIDEFSLEVPLAHYNGSGVQPTMASDGKYIYLLEGNSLLKIGSGFNGTYKGHVYGVNSDFDRDKSGWLGYCAGKLYFKRLSRRSNEPILIVNTDTLNIAGSTHINVGCTREGQNFLLFTDENSINAICTGKDDSLIVKQLYTSSQTVFELPLKLARKKFRTFGYAAFEDEILNQSQIQKIQSSYNMFEPKIPTEIDTQEIVCGKEFCILRASNGKVYYYGKSVSLGLKAVGRSPTMKLTELIVSKVSNIVQVAVGNDGIHALFVNDDGTVYFAGTARRGEDGDNSKNRRQPKAVKPKKLTKIDGHVITQAACNNGTSAFVTKTGKLIMFGKDTAHCDSLGFVTELADQQITKVALGKAHCVALNVKGHLFTFGLNNKGQCGRVFAKEKEPTSTNNTNNPLSITKEKYDFSIICDFDDHTLVQGQCRVCSVCKECTGYNVSCVTSQNVIMDGRIAGSLCPCGQGDAGCSKCGACAACIALQEGDSHDSKEATAISPLSRQRSKSLILRKKDKKISEENNPPSDVERDPPRVAPLAPQRVILPSSNPVIQISCGLHHTVVLTLTGEVFTFGSNQYGQLGTGDLQPVVGPVEVKVQGFVNQVAAGSNHTVLLTSKGMVYTFGNYQKGQLGRLPNDFHKSSLNDEITKDSDTTEDLAASIAIQRQKFLWNCTPGSVFGLGPNFGKKATWIGAGGDQTFIKIDESLITSQMLNKVQIVADKRTLLLIPTVLLPFHALTINRRDGSCIAHYKNQVNFVKMIQTNESRVPEINQNVNQNILPQAQDQMSRSVHETRNQIFELQENQNMLAEQKKRNRQEILASEKSLPQIAFCLDSFFNVLWVFDGNSKKMLCYNVIASEMLQVAPNCAAILSPELALSQKPDAHISRSQASLNLLACLDVLTSAQDAIPTCFEQSTPLQATSSKESHSNEYQIVNRFENFGGGWGYSGHSVEAIRFMSDTEVMICGFGMFGGRGEYSCKLKVFDLGVEGAGYEKDGVLISETKEIPYECPARSKYHLMLPRPFTASAGRWYLIWARIAGPSSDCGSSGQSSVTTEDQIVFSFKSSKKANNGTDVNSGQIPSIIYRQITQETKQPTLAQDIEPIYKISKSFANTVTKECFDSIVLLLSWSWETFKSNLKELKDKMKNVQSKSLLDHLVYVNLMCLRLMRKYITEIYPHKVSKSSKKATECNPPSNCAQNLPSAPKLFAESVETSTRPTNKKSNMENIQLAECIGNVRALLIQILCDDSFKDVNSEDGCDMVLEILDECHTCFVACFNAFYPTSSLKWNCLCDLLSQMDKGVLHARLLSAILAGLCNPSVQLKATFSLLTPTAERQSIISPSDNSGLPMLSSTENHQYPILVEQMIYRTQQEKIDFLSNSWTFKDVLLRLLDIICTPIRVKIENIYNRCGNYNELKYGKDINHGLINNCCHLLARVLAEIVYHTSISDFDATFMPPRSLHSTGSRFARCDVSRTWNTGNFGPDAIAFTVDRSGIAIAGAMVYSGSGEYEYQLELLYDNSVDPQIQHKWETLESISGSYDQDSVQNDMTEIKFERPIHIKENLRYALRLCSQGARTCSGDGGLASIRGPCSTTFTFHSCDLSFNGTTPTRGQIPCILYYSTPVKNDGHVSYLSETTARDTALQIATDITKKCTELLVLARNTLAASLSPSDKSPNSPNNTQTIDSEHNITPIEEHLDVTWANNSRHSVTQDANLSTARDITKRIGSFSKGIIETLKFDKRSTNPFDFEIEIGETEIHPKDLIEEGDVSETNMKKGRIAKLNGNERMDNNPDIQKHSKQICNSDSEGSSQLTVVQLLELFNINTSNMFTTLLPLVYAHVGALACSDPKSSVQILSLIKEILPHVAALNQLYATKEYSFSNKDEKSDKKENSEFINKKAEESVRNSVEMYTTSNHYCIVESEHPYKGSSLNTYRVEFPPCVQWMTVEFDSQCGTAQLEDCFVISIPARRTVTAHFTAKEDYSDMLDNNVFCNKDTCKNATLITSCYSRLSENDQEHIEHKPHDSEWVVIKKFNTSSNWSQSALVLPGNKIKLSLETASFYAQEVQANKYGFKTLVVGYDNPLSINLINSCLIRLEYELSYLGGMCSANLMKKDLSLPENKLIEDLASIEETLNTHSSLLSKGLALSETILTVNQALEPYLPVGSQSNERQFLKDFISGAPGSSGARLAAWLQPESRLDPNKCELNPIPEPVRYGWPTLLTITIRDQYGDTVVVPDLKVEVKAIPAGAVINGGRKMSRVSSSDTNSLGGVPPPPRLNYEPTIKEKMCFKAITFMKPYSGYSFEELRFCSPIQTRVTETIQAQDMEDGTFTISWIPNSVGSYCLAVSVDGIVLEEVYRIEVKEGGIPPPPQKSNKKPPSKLRKFIAKNSAGLRIRSHPTLQSEQLGIVKMDGIISFIDEIENDDGVWVRLSTESIRQHCTSGWYPTEAWCLQYNQHLGKTLLHPVLEAQTVKYSTTNLKQSSLVDNDDVGVGDLIPKTKIALSNKKGVDFSTVTPPLSSDSGKFSSTNPFIFTHTKTQNEQDKLDDFQSDRDFKSDIDDEDILKPHSHSFMGTSQSLNQSNIGSALAGVVGGGASKLQALQKWFKGDSVDGKDNFKKKSENSDIASVSVRDLVKTIAGPESRSNGNSNSATLPHISRSSSPVFIPSTKPTEGISNNSSSSKSVEVSDSSMLLGSMTRDLSQSSSQISIKEDMPSSPNRSSNHMNQAEVHADSARIGPPKHTPRKMRCKRPMSPAKVSQGRDKCNERLSELDIKISQTLSQNASQTSLYDQKTASDSTENSSPPVWPPSPVTYATTKMTSICDDKAKKPSMLPKRAMPPSLAESLRAVFSAFLWHEGIVHDAMACASFLKFHPSLPKEGALVVTRQDPNDRKIQLSREQKAQQRHSVEVANAGSYLNIRPSTLEALTKSGNSSINNRRHRKANFDNNAEEKPKLHSLPEVVTVLPPALRCLVYLWEQVCSNCVQIVQTNTLEQSKTSPHHSKSDKDKVEPKDSETVKVRKKKKEDGSWCEFCEIFLPIPVTHHMRIVHPGCGKSAKGKGYNSVGIYCEGWAGDCGEGGKGGSSWFLMCDTCREKYISYAKSANNINQVANAISPSDVNLYGVKATNLIVNAEIYTIMKENAIFLLELSSNTSGLLANQKRSPQQMPTVTEDQLNLLADLNKPSTSRGDSVPNSNRNSRIGFKMNGKFSGFSPTSNRRSGAFLSSISPELMWPAPDIFSCLESLGASTIDDLPYEIFGINSADNCFERPISEMSFDSCDLNTSDIMMTSSTHTTNTTSRFHRSFSMVHGWSDQHSLMNKNLQQDDPQQSKVIFRRRNNSSSDGEGSLLLCYPSENLRKLVPEKILSTSCIIHPTKNHSNTDEKTQHEKRSEIGTTSSTLNQGSNSKNFLLNTVDLSKITFNNQTEKHEIHHIDLEVNDNSLLHRPTLAFITQQHDLDKLRCAMKRSLRITTCRIYSLQALNWLIRSVTQTVCLHDLMWWFVSSLSASKTEEMPKMNDGVELALEHPVSITQISGRISQVLSQSLHVFLQSVADLTLMLPAGSSLQRIAIQCFGLKFRQADHQFLHSSHVFGNISKILSKSDEQNEAMVASSSAVMVDSTSHMLDHNFVSQIYSAGAKLHTYCDLSGMFEVTVSSRQAMAGSLTDNSTETFWESDEEDRNKCKIIEVSMNKLNYICKGLYVHIDNTRDIQNKVLSVIFFAGQSLGDTTLIKTVDVDSKACGWISADIYDDSYTHFRLEFRGSENTLRVRQIKLLGLPTTAEDAVLFAKNNFKLTNAIQIQQRSCEAETLRVFRLLTGQVFGKLISTVESLRSENMNLLTNHSVMESSANSLLADSLDLREHMVGILFSRSKLSHLQKQVIVHIVHAIRKEAQRAKEDWEITNATGLYNVQLVSDVKSDSSSDRFRAVDTYCFEMLSMVLALSGSAVGRSYLSHQYGLLKDLLSLLHTGSDRVQRQVTALLRRILPEMTPESLGDLLGVQKMPPSDFNIVNHNSNDFDMNRLGVLDIFLAVIAKSLQLQIKIKTTTKSSFEKAPTIMKLCNCIDFSVHLLKTGKKNFVQGEMGMQNHFDFETDQSPGNFDFEIVRKKPKDMVTPKNLNQRWFLKGVISIKQAESIISLIRDMASGKLSEKWTQVTKAAIAESVLNLTRLDEIFRSPENCVKTATLWLALASLCVLDKDHVEKLSSGQWSKSSDTRPMCSNHDDGETPAVIQCEACGSLCCDCDRFLHLSRKTRSHRRTVCKEEEEAIRVELHESCGRTKLFWLLALADTKTLKAIVEFRDGSNTIISGSQEIVGRCRFCGITGNSGLLAIGNVCADTQCQEHAANACAKTKSCGHICGGVANEDKCLPCLQHVCLTRENEMAESLKQPKLTQDADDMCMICFVEALSCAPSIQLECGHVFHYHCCKTVLEKRWTGPRITFGFSLCPICKTDIQHSSLNDILEPICSLKLDVKRKAVMRLRFEGVVKDTDTKDLVIYAMDRYAYYVCFKCQKAYYGGEARCDAEVGDNFDPQELVCGACSDVARAQMCPKHGTDFLEYKCRYCCSVAVFFCFGTTHFCDTCHDDFQRLTHIPKNKLPQCPAGPKAKQLLGEECPLHIVHPPTGEEFALGCGICRKAHTF